jgi:hypothetical protein
MSETDASKLLIVTGYSLQAARKKWCFQLDYFATVGEIKKTVSDEMESRMGYIARIQEYIHEYEMEVKIRVEGEMVSLMNGKAYLREMFRTIKTLKERLNADSSFVEVVVISSLLYRATILQGAIREGMGTKVTITDPEFIEFAGKLGLR